MHNKIALKLTLYFAAVLLVFALVVGGSFAHFFREHTVDIKSTELKQRAVRIAEVLSENAGWLEKRGGIANTRFISYINNITMEDVWVVNSDRELKLPQRMNHHMGMHRRMMHADTQAEVPPLKKFPRRSVTFEQLSDVTRNCVEQAFAGTVSVAEDFNPVREETMLCAAAPVYDENGAIQAAVLLHYPVQGLQSATWEGVRILLLSCAIALLLVSFLSVLFSWKFTKPLNRMKEVAQKMAEHDYTERCSIKQNDEIGALAATLDELGSRLLDADEAGRKLEKLRRSFIANISHELRTPVTVIRGSLEALNDKVVTDKEEVEQYYRQMLKESLFLQRLINDLLDLSRLQNTDFPIEKENINLCDVVSTTISDSAYHLLQYSRCLQFTVIMRIIIMKMIRACIFTGRIQSFRQLKTSLGCSELTINIQSLKQGCLIWHLFFIWSTAVETTLHLPPVWLHRQVQIHTLLSRQPCHPLRDQSTAVPISR